MSERRRWLTDKQLDHADRMRAELVARREAHIAKHGPHTCTPDPKDPWSTCDLEKAVAS